MVYGADCKRGPLNTVDAPNTAHQISCQAPLVDWKATHSELVIFTSAKPHTARSLPHSASRAACLVRKHLVVLDRGGEPAAPPLQRGPW